MISLKNSEDTPVNIAIGLAGLALVGLLVTIALAPKPGPIGTKATQNKVLAIQIRKSSAEKNQAVIDSANAKLTWNVPEQQVGGMALAKVSEFTRKSGLKLVSFRPQRKQANTNLIQLPYLATVDGTYLQVVQLARLIEQPESRLALTQVQIASADSDSDHVTASVAVVAYLPLVEEPKKNG